MSAISEDAKKEMAAAGEPPGGSRGRLRLASQEFFFLLQRIDRLDEKLSGEIRSLDEKLSGEIRSLDEKLSGEIRSLDEKTTALNEKINSKFNNLTLWTVGILVTIVIGFIALLLR